ncbi:hypothetical protein [Nocardia macrotermitis]|uniref:TrbL/VirB6 plasmid conjugal transfer protein n=1 Tax=Nocardia macrotermitis TaxID=2585198 RepID=A0A7K0CZR0_9NOCA|nr:hypothetical protein [Nocardia macrotermitis]MQY18955.1 hypothetical protein [Nocardia macrotermitis]
MHRQHHRLLAALAVFVMACTGLGAGMSAAHAAPIMPGTSAAGGDLPNGFPADLRQFIGGTAEFKSAPWFSGSCANRGGDVGAYINTAMAVEDRLLYWTSSDDQKLQLLHGKIPDTVASQLVSQGQGPPKSALPRVFPAGDATFHLPSPACRDDLKRWGRSPAWNVWSFDWAATPDKQSMQAIAAATTHAFAEVPAKAWTDPCGVNGFYCAHAFFADCAHADTVTGDQVRCQQWNVAVGNLFVGTADWLDLNVGVADRLGDAMKQVFGDSVGGGMVKAFSWVVHTSVDTARFVSDPQTTIDDWANAAKSSAVDLSTRVLDGLAATGRFDPSAPWFLHWYALSCGIGIMVMGAMTLLALWRASTHKETLKSLGADLFGYLPTGVLLMLFAPMIAGMLLGVADTASESVTSTLGPDMGEMITNLKKFVGEITASHMVGGVLVGLVLFLLLLVGALAVFFGLLMHQVALPCLAVAAGIGFGMWVHPTWRKKALRPVLLFIAIVFSKPLLFLMLAVLTGAINADLTDTSTGSDQLGILAKLCTVAVAFLVAGMAPWTLLRYAPLLPSHSDAAGFGQSSSMLAGAVGGAGSAMMWNRGMGTRRQRGRLEQPGNAEPGEQGTPGKGGADPKWRTGGRDDGKSSTEAGLGKTLTRSVNTEKSSASRHETGTVGRTSSGVGCKFGTIAKTAGGTALGAGVVAVPIAAQAASGALNKARSAAEAAPGEAEVE